MTSESFLSKVKETFFYPGILAEVVGLNNLLHPPVLWYKTQARPSHQRKGGASPCKNTNR